MLRRSAIPIVFLALLIGVVSCASVPKTVDEIPRITVLELKTELDKGSVTIVDVRGPSSFAAAHLPGSVNIPEQEVRDRVAELFTDELIVTYCT